MVTSPQISAQLMIMKTHPKNAWRFVLYHLAAKETEPGQHEIADRGACVSDGTDRPGRPIGYGLPFFAEVQLLLLVAKAWLKEVFAL